MLLFLWSLFILAFVIPITFIVVYYRKKSVDKESGQSNVAWYKPPNNINTLEASVLYSQHIDILSVHARLYELAVKGQLELQVRKGENDTKLRFKIAKSTLTEETRYLLSRIGIDETSEYIYASRLTFSNEFSGVDTALEKRILNNLRLKGINAASRSSNYFLFLKMLIFALAGMLLLTFPASLTPEDSIAKDIFNMIFTSLFVFLVIGVIVLFFLKGRRGKVAKQLQEYLDGYKIYLLNTNYKKFIYYKVSTAEEGYSSINLRDENLPWLILFSKNPNIIVENIY